VIRGRAFQRISLIVPDSKGLADDVNQSHIWMTEKFLMEAIKYLFKILRKTCSKMICSRFSGRQVAR
jgi:hypothetical protein